MPRSDLLQSSAQRVELDQRSREARLGLQRVERLLVPRSVPRQSLLRRALRWLGQANMADQVAGRSVEAASAKKRASHGRQMPSGIDCESHADPAPSVSWPSCRQGVRKTAITDIACRSMLRAGRVSSYARWCSSHMLPDSSSNHPLCD
jgi:hypothetical protein